jgi:hypothetical protein
MSRKSRWKPDLLTPMEEKQFFGAIRGGSPVSQAAALAGLTLSTVESWLRRGRGRDPERPAWPQYVKFAEDVERARAFANVDALNRTHRDHPEKWLDRLGPSEWREAYQQPTINVSVDAREQTGQFVIIPPEMLDDTVRKLLEQKRLLAAGEEPEEVVEASNGRRRSRLRDSGLRVEAGDVVTA